MGRAGRQPSSDAQQSEQRQGAIRLRAYVDRVRQSRIPAWIELASKAYLDLSGLFCEVLGYHGRFFNRAQVPRDALGNPLSVAPRWGWRIVEGADHRASWSGFRLTALAPHDGPGLSCRGKWGRVASERRLDHRKERRRT